jgi:hypothetical protein
MKSRDTGFTLVLIVLAAIIAIAAYYLLLNPALSQRSEAIASAEQARTLNADLENQLSVKMQEAEALPELREELAEMQAAFPPQENLSQVRRGVTELLALNEVSVVQSTLEPAVIVTPGGTILGPAAAAVGRESYIDGLVFQDLYGTTETLMISGTYQNVVKAIARLQMSDSRYYLVHSVQFQSTTGVVPDAPASAEIDLWYFVVYDPNAAVDVGGSEGVVDPEDGEPLEPVEPGNALDPVVTRPMQ